MLSTGVLSFTFDFMNVNADEISDLGNHHSVSFFTLSLANRKPEVLKPSESCIKYEITWETHVRMDRVKGDFKEIGYKLMGRIHVSWYIVIWKSIQI